MSAPEDRPLASDSAAVDAAERLLAECLVLPEDEREAALERALRDHPESAEDLRQRVRALQALGIEALPGIDEQPPFPPQLGDFRLEHKIGGGGMGVVYLATQTSLKREVALKLIRPERLYFDGARERFRREAEAIARLQHPGIVPVYTVGEDDGIPWFAMELVAGRTLAEALEGLAERAPESLSGGDLHVDGARTSWVEACLRVVLQVAEALAHAHDRGILHRDVKPSNVMITTGGRARLFDFGLTTSGREGNVTATGSQLGTLHYMSPEQLLDTRDVDERTDVYALGTTLYELLTLRVPYRGADELATQRLIHGGRPTSIRARNRRVPQDVETVCLAAMDRDRERRYASVADFARDLRNLLEHRPIEARPPGALLRARRFAQRNGALTTGLVLGALLLIGIPTALLVQQMVYAEQMQGTLAELEVALGEKGAALDEAERQRDLAEAAARQSKASFDFLLPTVLAARPEQAMGNPPGALEQLEHAEVRARAEFAADPELRAVLLASIGKVWMDLGRLNRAQPALEEALAAWEHVEQPDPVRLWGATRDMGLLSFESGRFERSEKLLCEALELSAALPEDGGNYWLESLNALAVLYQHSGRFDEAAELFERALAGFRKIEGPKRNEDLVACLINCGQIEIQLTDGYQPDRTGRALVLLEEAHSLARSTLPENHPVAVEAEINLAMGHKVEGHFDEAEAHYRSGVARARQVFGQGSLRLNGVLMNFGRLLEERGKLDEAEELYLEALELIERDTDLPTRARLVVLKNLATLAAARGDHAGAALAYDQLLPQLREFYGADASEVGHLHSHLGLAQARIGDDEPAVLNLQKAAEILALTPGYEHSTAGALLQAAEVLTRMRSPEARTAFERAIEYAEIALDGWPEQAAILERAGNGLRPYLAESN